ncbi:LamG domain-containing protein [Streptomyces sp. HNM0575]|uniref:LamG domain-containing protein n=1 Tax=Streptomyces sp. HNM0575 TaxID=2716338 RepID=UPI00145E8789|nr:LamG domain-containing protein [Streptomyces sp. HNM0575]NLU71924.1 LamG domain-containing protein [Streptomyces sp. HNM0575]
MECAHLSDAELLRLVRGGGEPSAAALRELERRHFQAVRVYASSCANTSSAADALAGQAWKLALRPQDGGASGAVRPRALSVVLRTAAAWSRTDRREALAPELITWIGTHVPAPPGLTAGADGTYGDGTYGGGTYGTAGADAANAHVAEPEFLPLSVAGRTFEGVADHSQTVLWHQAVEHDEPERIEDLLGPDAEAIPLLARRARSELYNIYVQLHQAGLADECRPFHRMVLAYAEESAIDMAADLAPHLEGCAACTRAVADLGRMRVDLGAFLAEAVLPWGGVEYAALRAEEDAPVGSALELLPAGAHLARAPGRVRRRLFGRWGAGVRPGAGRPAGRGLRANRLVQSLVLIGLASLAVAFAVSGNLRNGAPQSDDSKPSESAQPAPPQKQPGPSGPTATETATSTVTASPGSKPPGTGKKPPPASKPPVDGAILEWLFGGARAGVVADTSKHGRSGTLRGSPPATVSGGAVDLDGGQAVVSDGPVIDTESSFSVSARVRLDDTEDDQAVVTQDADESSGFLLQYDADEDRWEMRIPFEDEEDAEDADADEAAADFGPEEGEWTQLTGVYDDPDDEIRLYVDGRLQDTTEHADDFAAEGVFAVGRGLSFGEGFRGVEGTVDDVRVFAKPLTTSQAAALAR